METLDSFIRKRIGKNLWPNNNAYVTEPGFESLYVRMSVRMIDGEVRNPVLDLASMTANHPGNGAFTALVKRLRKDWPELGLFVENSLQERFQKKLETMGFRSVGPDELPCFWMTPVKETP